MAKETSKKISSKPAQKGRSRGLKASAPAAGGKFPIVGVGASAGGLEAFSELLRALPPDPGMAFVFVQHLDPKHVSLLAQLLGRESKMPVSEAQDGVPVERDRVYVIPKNTTISIVDGVLRLGPRELVAGHFTSIDTFLRSLAADQGHRAVAVLLSGSASDGSVGLRAIKAAGGITFAQEPGSAKFDGMPRSAIAAGCVDFVYGPAEIARELLQLGRYQKLNFKPEQTGEETATDAAQSIDLILGAVRAVTGVDFSQYKETTVKRRILRRMMLRRTEDFKDYLSLLRADPEEVRALYEDILINVTEFFRDPDAFEAFARLAFPQILSEKRGPERPIRIWVPGCSSGEEVYSLAISLLEFLGSRPEGSAIQVFATDVSETALDKARSGVYPGSIKDNVNAERLRRFFIKHNSGYRISKAVRDLCVFARHNLTSDPPFSKIDLISCRNVLIYLGSVLQQRVIPMFHYALKPGGVLLLGPSETVSQHPEMFQLIDKKNKIYQRKPGRSRMLLNFTRDLVPEAVADAPPKANAATDLDLQREADRLVLSRYGPPAVVVDDDMNIIQFRGQTSRFLEPAPGTASLNLLRIVKEEFAAEVKNAIAKARRDNASVRREGLYLTAGSSSQVNLQVIPFRRLSGSDSKYLVVFENPLIKLERKGAREGAPPLDAQLRKENTRLRQELAAARDYLQSIIEDQQAAQEELRSAAEEIQSSNEELQSTNEELETAKEELQSTNEELNTVNEELQNRNMQLSQVGNDLLNLLTNVNMPVLILSNDHRIRRFTPAAEKTLHLIPSDVGRPVGDINLHIQVPDLSSMLTEVTETLTPKILEVTDQDGLAYSLRVRPYRTDDNRIDGVVMLFIEIDQVMRSTALTHAGLLPLVVAGPGGGGAAVLLAQEEERRRVAHELHDELNQKLALLEFNLQSLAGHAGEMPEEVQRQFGDFRKSVADLSDNLRRLAYQFYPVILDDLGLVVALRSYCEEFSVRERIQVRFSDRNVPADLPHAVSVVCYRVVQECLRNVAKHSGAKRATVSLSSRNGKLELEIRDAGSGFKTELDDTHGLGIRGLRERVAFAGGIVEWKSSPGEGTRVSVDLPIPDTANGVSGSNQK